MNEFVKPNPYFVYFMFKDTIHVDDYGSIKETLFKFPSMTRVSLINANSALIALTNPSVLSDNFRVHKIKYHAFTCSVMMSTLKSAFATMLMKTNGRSRSWVIAMLASSISAPQPSLLRPMRFWLLVEAVHQRKTLDSIWLLRTRSRARAQWTRAGTRMPSLNAAVMSMFWAVSVANSALIVSRSMN